MITRDLDDLDIEEMLDDLGLEMHYDYNLVDSLIEALYETYPYWRSWRVRIEQNSIVRKSTVNKCDICGELCSPNLHHIVPVVIGGGNEESNLAWLCHTHHRAAHEAKAYTKEKYAAFVASLKTV